MLDFGDWVARAQAFTAGLTRLPGNVEVVVDIAPPLTNDAREALETSLSLPLPLSLRMFLEQGSSDCYCRYTWDPPEETLDQVSEIIPHQRDLFGGLRCWSAVEILAGWQHFQQMAAEAGAAGYAEYREFWQHRLPFAFILNGDYLALDLSQKPSDPPVVYISHEDEDEGGVIAPTFEAFLQSWEQLCHVGPEIWLLGEFRNPNTGLLDPNSDKAHKLRQLLGVDRQTG